MPITRELPQHAKRLLRDLDHEYWDYEIEWHDRWMSINLTERDGVDTWSATWWWRDGGWRFQSGQDGWHEAGVTLRELRSWVVRPDRIA